MAEKSVSTNEPAVSDSSWTEAKLQILEKYLHAYTTILSKRRGQFKFAYIDAFAGTGDRKVTKTSNAPQFLLPEFEEPETREFLDGSAVKALKVEPKFETCIFIEKSKKRFDRLQSKLKTEFPDRDIRFRNEDANAVIQQICSKNWSEHRAVLFLDPYGMQVSWQTIENIARTKAIDLWILFPLGVAVNRLLKKDGQIDESWKNRLDTIFGTDDWFNHFYIQERQAGLFEESATLKKTASFETIGKYFIQRLQTIFPYVAKNPYRLLNSSNNPLYLFCFAANNATALKIAEDILKKF